MFHSFLTLFGQLLLPIFMVALLFSLIGVGPEIVLRSATSIAESLISGTFNLLRYIITRLFDAIFGKASRSSGRRGGGTGSGKRGPGTPPKGA